MIKEHEELLSNLIQIKSYSGEEVEIQSYIKDNIN